MINTSVSQEAILGVDIGGTKVALGLVDHGGAIIKQSRRPMIVNSTPEAALQAVTDAVDSMFAEAVELGRNVQAIGICAPGPLDPVSGTILNPPNVPCWRNFSLA